MYFYMYYSVSVAKELYLLLGDNAKEVGIYIYIHICICIYI